MTTIIKKLDESLSEMIFQDCGPILSQRENEMLDYCQRLGEVYIGYVDGDLVCCWGLIPPSFLSNQAYIWMWASGSVPHQFLFVRHSQRQVKKFLERYDSIVGQCKLNAHSAQRWLKWLGAEFGDPRDGTRPFVINRST